MPSAFSHAIAAIALTRGAPQKTFTAKLVLMAMFSAAVPDLDSIGYAMGVPYEHVFSHRGITHSVFFASFWAALMTVLLFRRSSPLTAFVVLFLATLSHPLLDMLTNGGLGCALWAPFNNERLFFACRPIRVSPIAVGRFFSGEGVLVLQSEFVWIWFPSGFVFALASLVRRRPTA